MKPMRALLRIPALFLSVALAGCATAPGIPDTTYFRLPPAAVEIAPVSGPLDQPIVVDTLLADGLHSDQALIYSLDADAARLKAYHYQLWVDPPVRMLQRRLISALRSAEISPVVADRLPVQVKAIRIEGRLERFERVRIGEDWHVAVVLALRADARDGRPPLLLRTYARELPAGGRSVRDSVQAMGLALDQIYAEFIEDFHRAARGA